MSVRVIYCKPFGDCGGIEATFGRDRWIFHFPVAICHFSFGAPSRMKNEKWKMARLCFL